MVYSMLVMLVTFFNDPLMLWVIHRIDFAEMQCCFHACHFSFPGLAEDRQGC